MLLLVETTSYRMSSHCTPVADAELHYRIATGMTSDYDFHGFLSRVALVGIDTFEHAGRRRHGYLIIRQSHGKEKIINKVKNKEKGQRIT